MKSGCKQLHLGLFKPTFLAVGALRSRNATSELGHSGRFGPAGVRSAHASKATVTVGIENGRAVPRTTMRAVRQPRFGGSLVRCEEAAASFRRVRTTDYSLLLGASVGPRKLPQPEWEGEGWQTPAPLKLFLNIPKRSRWETSASNCRRRRPTSDPRRNVGHDRTTRRHSNVRPRDARRRGLQHRDSDRAQPHREDRAQPYRHGDREPPHRTGVTSDGAESPCVSSGMASARSKHRGAIVRAMAIGSILNMSKASLG